MNSSRRVLAVFLFALLLLPTLCQGRGIGGDVSFRFLWPSDPAAPGEERVELETEHQGDLKDVETPAGRASGSRILLRLPSGEAVAGARLMKLEGEDAWVFETKIKKEITAATGVYETPHFALPAIKPPPSHSRVFTFRIGAFSPPTHEPISTTGPVILYSEDLEVVVISPLDHFLESMTQPVEGEWRCGFGGMIERLPEGTMRRVMVVKGRGINNTVMKWGDLVRKWHDHERVPPYHDVALSRLGYWTDNGAMYYYKTAPKMNYHETLIAVKEEADRRDIPYGYFQIDSWWYPKAKTGGLLSAFRGGCIKWEPQDKHFPRGLESFQEELGLPLVAHNRWYDHNTPYCDKYECVYGKGDKTPALPVEPEFWDEIMDNAVRYGVAVYEQDWLITQMNLIPWLRSELGHAELWFESMAGAAHERGLTMQLCMAPPGFFLQQMKHDHITHVRTSGDYQGGVLKTYFWPKFHKTSMFAYAVGFWPFKDNFQSSSGQRFIRNERWAYEEALISVLSGGPVGPADELGAADRELLMKTCRDDGVLLKSDRPATPIDLMFLDNKKPWIAKTETSNRTGHTFYLAAFNIRPLNTRDKSVSFQELDISGDYGVYDYRSKKMIRGQSGIEFGRMKKNRAAYYIIAPRLDNGMYLVGETDKFVTLSNKRFPEVGLEGNALSMQVEGVPGEDVGISIYVTSPPERARGCELKGLPPGKQEGMVECSAMIPDSGKAQVSIE